jgi:hypothetical protein
MNSITFSKNSWHYRLVTFIKSRNYVSTDFCGYFWDVVTSIIAAFIIFCGLLFVTLATIIYPLIYLVVSLQNGFFDVPQEVIIGTTIDVFFILISIFFYIQEVWYPEYKERKYWRNFSKLTELPKPKEPSFIAMSWNKFKDKTCFRVEFK